jgi:hypothetical protein
MIFFHFLFAVFYIMLLSILLYGYLLFFKLLWRLFIYTRIKYKNFRNRKDAQKLIPISRQQHFKNGWNLFPNKRKNISILVVLFLISMTLFLHHLQKNTTDKNKHFEAKNYFAVGETANNFKFLALHLFHPDFPLLLPIEWFQRLVYWHGSFLLPDNDDEKYLWEQLWFYNPYTILQTPPWDYHAKPITPIYNNSHFSKIYNNYMIALEKTMDGNISDRKLFYDVVPRDISSNLEFAVIFQMYEDGLRYTGEAGIHIARDEKYQKQTDNLYRYSKIAQKWWDDGVIPENIRDIPTQKLTFLEAKLTISDDRLFRQLMLNITTCDSPYIDDYLESRQDLADAITPKYEKRFSMMLNTYRSMFYNYLFPRYCNKEFPIASNKIHKRISRWRYIEDQETNLRIGTGYDLQTKEDNATLAPLFEALKDKNTSKVIKELVSKNLSADVRFFGKKTPLHYAAHYNDIKTMEALLKHGASINAQDKANKIPLQYAVENFNYEATNFLLEHNSSHKWVPENIRKNRSYDGDFFVAPWEYLMVFGQFGVARKKTTELVKLLAQHDVNLFTEIQHCKGMTFLHMAALGYNLRTGGEHQSQVEIIKILLEKGLDYKAKDCNGESAYEIATRRYSWMHLVFEPYMSEEDIEYFKNKKRR